MMKTPRSVSALSAGLVAVMLTACGDDGAGGSAADGGGGDAAAVGGGGGRSGSGGSAGQGGAPLGGAGAGGSSGGGASGTAGAAPDGGSPEAGGPDGDAGSPPLCRSPTDGGLGAAEGAVGARISIATNDFVAGTSTVTTVDLATGARLQPSTVPDFDAVVARSDGRAFVLERTNGVLHEIGADGALVSDVDLNGDGGAIANPHAVVVVPGTDKAYVSLYGENAIAVVDLATGTVTGRIDLSSLLGASDADGSVDVDSGVFDPTTGRAYFVLQRVDLTTVTLQTNYQLLCGPEPGLLVGVDPTSDTLVDFAVGASGDAGTDAGDAGQGVMTRPYVELSLVAAQGMALDAANGRVVLVDSGCYDAADGGYTLRSHGVEAVSLATGATTTLLSPSNDNYYSRLWLLSSSSAVLGSLDGSYVDHFNLYEPGQATLGAELAGVPAGAAVETPTTLVGVRDGDLVRYDVGSQQSETLLLSPCLWDGLYVAASVIW
jgi:hypothetical protein